MYRVFPVLTARSKSSDQSALLSRLVKVNKSAKSSATTKTSLTSPPSATAAATTGCVPSKATSDRNTAALPLTSEPTVGSKRPSAAVGSNGEDKKVKTADEGTDNITSLHIHFYLSSSTVTKILSVALLMIVVVVAFGSGSSALGLLGSYDDDDDE